MSTKLPSLALMWFYQGKDSQARLERVRTLNYPDFQIIEVRDGHGWSRAIKEIRTGVQICVFWVDDGKPIGNDFLERMAVPVTGTNDSRAAMHFWSGNALSIPRELMSALSIEDDYRPTPSILKLLLPVLGVANKPAGRVHVAFSSTERLAPLSMDPVGIPS